MIVLRPTTQRIAEIRQYAGKNQGVDELLVEIDCLNEELNYYKILQEDKRRLTRELDVAICGKEGAAEQASLCDLIEPARNLRQDRDFWKKRFSIRFGEGVSE